MFPHQTKIQRTSVEQNDRRVGIDRGDFPQKLLLNLRKFQDAPARCLAGLEKMLSQEQHHFVRLPGSIAGLSPQPALFLLCICFLPIFTEAHQLRPGIQDRTALCKRNVPFRHQSAGRLLHRHSVPGVPQERPSAQQLLSAHIRPDQRNFFFFFQRKKIILIFQKHERTLCSFPGQRPVLLTQNHRMFFLRICSLKRILKKSQSVFQFKDPHHRLVQQLLTDFSSPDQLFQLFRINAGHHVDIHAGFQRTLCRIRPVTGQSVGNGLSDRTEITDQHTVESHLIAENSPHQLFVDRRRNIVDRIKRSHHQRHAGVHRRLISREIIFPERPLCQLHRVIISSCLRSAVACKMLDTCPQRLLPGQIVSLIPFRHRFRKLAVQVDIFPCGLHDPSPAGVPHQVRHRRKRDVKACGRRFTRSHLRTFSGELRQEGRPLRQRNRINRAIPVDDIQHENQRNMMGMTFHIFLLNFADFLCAAYAQHRTGQRQIFLCHSHLLHGPHRGGILGQKLSGNLEYLADLFS